MANIRSERFHPAVLIPVYNHPDTIENVVKAVLAQHFPVILVDDGSDNVTRAACERAAEEKNVMLIRRTENGGKGAAVLTGFHAAAKAGYTHLLQIDADGQHDLSRVTPFIALARRYPDQLICGYPEYDRTVPPARYWGRKLTNFWVDVNALTLSVEDAMCGMRVYPVAAVEQLAARTKIGLRMEFDPEILVRLIWMGLRIRNLPVRVTYPKDGISHFQGFADNVRISGMHAKLCILMLTRIPVILMSRLTGWMPPEPEKPKASQAVLPPKSKP